FVRSCAGTARKDAMIVQNGCGPRRVGDFQGYARGVIMKKGLSVLAMASLAILTINTAKADNAVVTDTKKAGSAVENGAKKVGGATVSGAKKVGGGIKKGAEAVGSGAKKA